MVATFVRGSLCAVVVLAFTFTSLDARAQIQNPIQAARDAYHKSKQQQQQRQGTQPSPAQTASPPQASSGQGAGDCCSPEAMKRTAADVGFLDIVGVKLGMTPEQAFGAIKAFNPRMKIDIIKVRLETPDNPGNFTRVPQFAVAHSVGPPPRALGPLPFNLADGSSDEIVMEFTLPPSPPLVSKITREVIFANGQPVMASNLIEAMRKKYGQENFPSGGALVWLFESSGKPLARHLADPERYCVPATPFDGFRFRGGGVMPGPDDLAQDAGTLNLTTTAVDPRAGGNSERVLSACRPFTIAMNYGLGQDVSPNAKVTNMVVTIESPALLYGSLKSTHDWMQAKLDAKTKQQDDAAKQRSAPPM